VSEIYIKMVTICWHLGSVHSSSV